MGRLAVSLLEQVWLEEGDHEVVFDGGHLPSGIYICRLSAGSASTAQKIILLK